MQKHFQLITILKKSNKKLKFNALRVLALENGLVQKTVMQEKPLWALRHGSEAMRYCSLCKLTRAVPSLYGGAGETGSGLRIAPENRANHGNHSKEELHQNPWG